MQPQPKNVLLVDDDANLIKVLSKYLQSQGDDFRLLTASSGRQALDIIAQQDVPLVVSDINMPNMSGLELLAEIRERHPQTGVILMTAYSHRKPIREGVANSGCLEFIEKPFSFEHLHESIKRHLGRHQDGFAGTLKNIQLTDLIQMCCLSMVDMAIRVRQGADDGVIHIHDGNIVHAVCRNHTGEEAFFDILGWKSGSFETFSAPVPDQCTITSDWQYLLMEGCRRLDEEDDDDGEIESGFSTEGEAGETVFAPAVADEPKRQRVLIVDDSAMMCRILTDVVSSTGELEVVGTARNGEDALEKIDALQPDLITLDVNMPVMGGSTALKHIMIRNPCPVVIVSSLGKDSGATIIDFLKLGAVDFVGKPSRSGDMALQQAEMVESLKASAAARPENFQRVTVPKPQGPTDQETDSKTDCRHLVLVNSGKGGYAELIRLIPALGPLPGACLVAVQSMPRELAVPLADYLQSRSRCRVALLSENSPLKGGFCYIGSHAVAVEMKAEDGVTTLGTSPSNAAGNSQPPVFDRLLTSATHTFKGKLSVLLMSGATVADPAILTEVRNRGGNVIVQELSTCLLPDPLRPLVDGDFVSMQIPPRGIPKYLSDANGEPT